MDTPILCLQHGGVTKLVVGLFLLKLFCRHAMLKVPYARPRLALVLGNPNGQRVAPRRLGVEHQNNVTARQQIGLDAGVIVRKLGWFWFVPMGRVSILSLGSIDVLRSPVAEEGQPRIVQVNRRWLN